MRKSLLLISATLFLLLIGFVQATECADADYVFEETMWVVGDGCHNSNRISDSMFVDVEEGRYYVEGLISRGNVGQCQTNEDFFLEINSDFGPDTEDDLDACAISTRMEYLGIFDFTQDSNEIIIHTAAQCPPDTYANSVDLTKICLYLEEEEPECGNEVEEKGEECDDGNTENGDGCSSECLIEENECCTDDDCEEDYYSEEHCEEGNVYVDFYNFFCEDGTCMIEILHELIDECDDDCEDGECIDYDDDSKSSGKRRVVSFCDPLWKCSDWSKCVKSMKSRQCVDENYCEESYNKPLERVGCNMPKVLIEPEEKINWGLIWVIIIALILLIILIGLMVKE